MLDAFLAHDVEGVASTSAANGLPNRRLQRTGAWVSMVAWLES
jgi:hypothetical protein